MNDILARDHARGCAGREYACTCGYDDEKDAEIERLRAALAVAENDLRWWRDGVRAAVWEKG